MSDNNEQEKVETAPPLPVLQICFAGTSGTKIQNTENEMMSEFERKTLSFAMSWSFFSFVVPTTRLDWWGDFGLHVFCGATIVFCLLFAFFGLWRSNCWDNGFYFREDNLTEREKFLSYKETARTFPVFFLSVGVLLAGYGFIDFFKENLTEWTVDVGDLLFMGMILFVMFAAIQSWILLAYLRNERLRNSPTDQEPPA